MAKFPTVTASAEASQAEVVRSWAGLGYNRRAVNLHRAAVQMARSMEGVVPRTSTRCFGFRESVRTRRAQSSRSRSSRTSASSTRTSLACCRRRAGRRLTTREAQATADALVPPGASWEWNQRLMDLGALVCTARAPACDRCWLRHGCRWTGEVWSTPKQSAFAGSDRQGRGRLITALRERDVAIDELASVMGWPDDPARAERVAARLVDEGIVEVRQAVMRLTISS